MAEIDGRLVAAGWDGNLHVLDGEQREWDTFGRDGGYVYRVVNHRDVCLAMLNDKRKYGDVIEQFCLDKDKKWRFCMALPKELQIKGVSFVLSNNSLYAIGGKTKQEERLSNVFVCDLHCGHWLRLDDMQTRRSYCSSVVIDDTLFVGGGHLDELHYSNTVECLDIRVKKWRTIASTSMFDSTLTAVGKRLIGTGGLTQTNSGALSNVVEFYDERYACWLPLPTMTHVRFEHAAVASEGGEVIAAGGFDKDLKRLISIESLKIS